MQLFACQALLSNPQNVAQVQALIRDIERVGSRISVAPPTKGGMVLVILELPEGYIPDQFFPGMPFYPM